VTVFRYTKQLDVQPDTQANSASYFSRMGNEYWPKCGDAVWLGVKAGWLITFCVSRRRRERYCGHARLCVCVCVSVRGRIPTLLHRPRCNLGEW